MNVLFSFNESGLFLSWVSDMGSKMIRERRQVNLETDAKGKQPGRQKHTCTHHMIQKMSIFSEHVPLIK